MAKKAKVLIVTDLFGFMSIILMLTGVLITILVLNVVIIGANPESITVTSVVRAQPIGYVKGTEKGAVADLFPFGNNVKRPRYVDVYRDHLVIYPTEEVLSLKDLELPGNAFEKLLTYVASDKERQYVILLVRPRSATVARRLKQAIRDRGIDVGFELYEEGRPIQYRLLPGAEKG